MRRLLLLAAMVGMAMLLASPAVAQSGADGSFNCPDFGSEAEAQAYYDSQGGLAGGDPDGLDADSDGLACEDSGLPSGGTVPNAETPEVENPAPATCEGFTTSFGEQSQFQAQQYFDFIATPEERAILDPDGNGFACDGGTIEFGVDPAEATAPVSAPVASTDTETPASTTTSVLPDTGGPSMLLPIGALLVGAGVLTFAVIRRR